MASVREATCSLDPRTQVGAVLVNPTSGVVLGMGYNDFPPGTPQEFWQDREKKNRHVIHAEVNAIADCVRAGCNPWGAVLYGHYAACSQCCKTMLAFGVKDLVTWAPAIERARETPWLRDIEEGFQRLRAAGGSVTLYPDPLEAGVGLRFDGQVWEL